MSRRGTAKNLGRADAFQMLRAKTLKSDSRVKLMNNRLKKAKAGKLYKTAQANKNYISGYQNVVKKN